MKTSFKTSSFSHIAFQGLPLKSSQRQHAVKHAIRQSLKLAPIGPMLHGLNAGAKTHQSRNVSLKAQFDDETAMFTEVARKALEINLNPKWYGVLAEIGAGQEVSRWFFRVGGAAGTIAKSVSAYDMTISDTTYGQADRYVTEDRVKAMLDFEYLQVNLALRKERGKKTAFFAFADTVTAKAYMRDNECHGWLGIKYQDKPEQSVPNQIMIHIRMLDNTAQLQQEAVGALGINLIYGALTCQGDTNKVIEHLLDDLNRWRITVDLIDFSGPAFPNVDNRVAALRLVQKELCDAALFDPSGKSLIPQEHLYKQNVLLLRGQFRPFTLLHNDMLMGAAQQFFCAPDETSISDESAGIADRSATVNECVYREDSTVILELTTRSMMEGGDLLDWTSNSGIQEGAYLQTIEALSTLGYIVMVTNQGRYFRLADYLSSFTKKSIVIAMGIPALKELFKEKQYLDLEGGILEGFGRLLKFDLKIYVYPTLIDGQLITSETLKVDPPVQKLYDYIRERGTILPIKEYDTLLLKTGDVSKYVQQSIRAGTDEWEQLVPVHVRDQIKNLQLLGYTEHSSPQQATNGKAGLTSDTKRFSKDSESSPEHLAVQAVTGSLHPYEHEENSILIEEQNANNSSNVEDMTALHSSSSVPLLPGVSVEERLGESDEEAREASSGDFEDAVDSVFDNLEDSELPSVDWTEKEEEEFSSSGSESDQDPSSSETSDSQEQARLDAEFLLVDRPGEM